MRGPIDEDHIAGLVQELRDEGFPATEGYYLVILSPLEAEELRVRLSHRKARPSRRHEHPPYALTETARIRGFETVCVLDDALVVSADYTRVDVPRRSEQPALRLVR